MPTNQFAGLFDQAFKDTFTDAIDALIDAFELPCTIHYISTKFITCTDCTGSNRGNRGPNPFIGGGNGTHTGTCPTCVGDRKIEVPNTESVNLIVIWDQREFVQMGTSVKAKDGQVQVFCRIANIKKLKKARYVIFNTNIASLTENKYRIMGEPMPCGLGKDAYIVSNWEILS